MGQSNNKIVDEIKKNKKRKQMLCCSPLMTRLSKLLKTMNKIRKFKWVRGFQRHRSNRSNFDDLIIVDANIEQFHQVDTASSNDDCDTSEEKEKHESIDTEETEETEKTEKAEKAEKTEKTEIGKSKEKECPICLDVMVFTNKSLKAFPCGHIYHKKCADQWLEKKRTCPVCCYYF